MIPDLQELADRIAHATARVVMAIAWTLMVTAAVLLVGGVAMAALMLRLL